MGNSICVILNPDLKVSEWQFKCLLKLKSYNFIFLIANDKNNNGLFKKRKYFNNIIYYLINIISIKQRKIKIKPESFNNASVKKIFFTIKKNQWQELSSKSIEDIISEDPAFIYKCGMNLLNVNEKLKHIPIISHHHGDPSKFRGRPSGFYELLKSEKKIGQIVQIISNKLDAGGILSYGESKIYPWSYKKTLKDAYALSPLIFEKALTNLKKGILIDKKTNGHNYRLPSNILSLIFIGKEILNLIFRIRYGFFYEKSWQVAYLKNFSIKNIKKPEDLFNFIDNLSNNFETIKVSRAYDFYADPFIIDSNIIVEGLKRFSYKGNLLLIDLEKNSIIEKYGFKNKHLSYPYTEEFFKKKFVYPDSGSHRKAIILNGENLYSLKISYMKSFKNGLVDPSVIEYNGVYYLFGNYPNETSVLRLWISLDPLFNDAIEHNDSPICISPEGGRSGGRVFKFNGKFYRFGQDYSDDYGNGLILFEITNLSSESYSEDKLSSYKFKHLLKGPHTLDFSSNLITWDFYIERFNFLAGLKRILGRM